MGWIHSVLHCKIFIDEMLGYVLTLDPQINFPTSLPVLYTLPAAQAQIVIQKSPKLKEALQKIIESLPPVQRQRREFQKLIPLLQ
jgi:hypothetical protein